MPYEPNVFITDYICHSKKTVTRVESGWDSDMDDWGEPETITRTIDVDSECEGIDRNDVTQREQRYKVGKPIGSGAVDMARPILGTNLVVLSPKEKSTATTEKMANTKYTIAKAFNPTSFVHLSSVAVLKSYRLFQPLAKGKMYSKVAINTIPEGLQLYLAAIKALQLLHSKLSLVYIDLKGDNIFYDKINNTSTLIDGGSAVKIGEKLNPGIYGSNFNMAHKHTFPQIAPECWSKVPPRAHKTMDIYSLGTMMNRQMRHLMTHDESGRALACLLKTPMHKNPFMRPSFNKS